MSPTTTIDDTQHDDRQQALTNFENLMKRVDARWDHAGPANCCQAVEQAGEEYVAMHREVPGFLGVKLGDPIGQNVLSDTQPNTDVVAGRLADRLHERFKLVDTHQVRRVLLAACLAFDAVIERAFTATPQGDPILIELAFAALRGVLERLPTTDTTDNEADD